MTIYAYKFRFSSLASIFVTSLVIVVVLSDSSGSNYEYSHHHNYLKNNLDDEISNQPKLSRCNSPACQGQENDNNGAGEDIRYAQPSRHHESQYHHNGHHHEQHNENIYADPEKTYVFDDSGMQIGVSYQRVSDDTGHVKLLESEERVNLEDELKLSEFDYGSDNEIHLKPHYALDNRKAVRLALLEQKISTTLLVISLFDTRNEIPKGDRCYQSLRKYLEDYEDDTRVLGRISGFSRAMNVTANPLLLYRMIRRMVVTLQKEVMNACKMNVDNLEINEAVERIVDAANLTLPTFQDLDDALLGVLRIHYVYGFNASSELRIGKFGNVDTNVILNFYDCLELGKKALAIKANILAFQWFQSADVSLSEIPMEEMRQCSDDLDSAWAQLLEHSKIKMRNLFNMLKHARQESLPPFLHSYNQYRGCRGETQMPETERAHLVCFMTNFAHPYFVINPVKTELLNAELPVLQFYDFIGDKTIDYLKKSSIPKMERSGVVNKSKLKAEFSGYRTSMQTWLYDDPYDVELMKLNRRIELLTGLEVIKQGASHALQIVSYSSLGGHYDFHQDSMGTPVLTSKDGDRIATFLMFFSDVQLGGYTAFPVIDVATRPQKGSAILWYSLYRNGEPDESSMHGGCPVILGSKLVANKWILYNQNFLKFKCSLRPEE